MTVSGVTAIRVEPWGKNGQSRDRQAALLRRRRDLGMQFSGADGGGPLPPSRARSSFSRSSVARSTARTCCRRLRCSASQASNHSLVTLLTTVSTALPTALGSIAEDLPRSTNETVGVATLTPISAGVRSGDMPVTHQAAQAVATMAGRPAKRIADRG